MSATTLIEALVFFFGNPIGWFLTLVFAMLGNCLVVYALADAYLRRNSLKPLERPAFGDREADGRLMWQLLTLRDAPDMGVGLRLSLWLNRILIAMFALCLLSIPISLILSH